MIIIPRRNRNDLETDINSLVVRLKDKVEGIPEPTPWSLNEMSMQSLYAYEKSLQGAIKSMKNFM